MSSLSGNSIKKEDEAFDASSSLVELLPRTWNQVWLVFYQREKDDHGVRA